MFVVIQLPFADARPFVAGARRLRVPPWPLPEPEREFVRAVGQVRERRRGGVSPWSGEDVYCDARRILRIEPAGLGARRGVCRFRRLLSDGGVRSRIEIGLVIRAAGTDVSSSLDRALSVPFSTLTAGARITAGPLELRRPLARQLLRSTTGFRTTDPFREESWWLEPVRPLMIVESRDGDAAPPSDSRMVPVAQEHGISLHTFTVSRAEADVRVWLVRPQPHADRDVLRRLRMHLLCLHSERMALRAILRLVATGRLANTRGSDEFNDLQRYLMGAFRSLGRERRHGIRRDAIFDVADEADGLVSDDVRGTLLERLADARLNLRRTLERQLASEAAAKAMTRIWNELSAAVDLATLAEELERLRASVAGRELTLTQRDGLVEVAEAAGAARHGNGPGALAHLSRAGRWILDLARATGVDVAAAVIARLLG